MPALRNDRALVGDAPAAGAPPSPEVAEVSIRAVLRTGPSTSRRGLALGLALFVAVGTSTAGAQTGTFIDRLDPDDLRVVTYNVNWDAIFPDVDQTQADKFDRVVNALDPDILCLQEINRSAAEVANLMDNIAPLSGGGSWQAHKGRDSVIVTKYPLSMTATATVPAAQYDLALALVDLPDALFGADFYIMNDHFKCCGGSTNDAKRQRQADALVNWMRDARTPGENIDLPNGTAMAVIGDLNMVGSLQPLITLITGDIVDNGTYGPDSPPDWDGTDSTDAHPLHNVVGPDDYTWRNDNSSYDPGRLDFVIYTDSAITETYKFVLNTVDMTSGDLAAAGLQRYDVCMDEVGSYYDHLPVIVDFVGDASFPDCNGNGVPDDQDIAGGTSPDCQPNGIPDECEPDADGDTVPDDCDGCPNDPAKTDPGVCGCGTPDDDSDGDAVPDCDDLCPNDPNKTNPGVCGCGVPDDDTDGDGIEDCNDNCPWDYNEAQRDSDMDGVGNRCDNCKFDYNPGQEDADGDGVGDVCDGCPNDPDKSEPGICGCGTPDTDGDGDQTPDCNDACPSEPALTTPSEPGTELTCGDGIDNDCDGLTDTQDSQDCAAPGCICGDIDGSGGSVNLDDFATFAVCYGFSGPAGDCSQADFDCSDLDGSGLVDLEDFATFALYYGLITTNTVPNCPQP